MNVMIIDDEPLARQHLQLMIAGMPHYAVIGEVADGKSALTCACGAEPDIVLLDTHMPDTARLDIAAKLSELSVPPIIMFTAACLEHTFFTHDSGVTGYLLKPVKQADLAEALGRAKRPSRKQLQSLLEKYIDLRQYFITANTPNGSKRVALDDIVYFWAEDKYTTMHHTHGEVLINESLNTLEQRFGNTFLRIHRKVLVAARFITDLYTDDDGSRKVRLYHCDRPLPVSRRRLGNVRNSLITSSGNS